MTWRTVVISSRAKLELRLNYLLIRRDDLKKIFLSEISTIIIESTSVAITSALMCELIKRKIKVIFCDEKRNPCFELAGYYGSHDCSNKLRNQAAWTKETKDMVWARIVADKIKRQRDLIKYYGYDQEAELLASYIEEIQPGDISNREGHAAKVYFNALFGMDFSRKLTCDENSALNYGYAVILSAFNREIVANGCVTQLGIFHNNTDNRFNLGCDMMEPFRPLVDKLVYESHFKEFGPNEKHKVVNVLNKEVRVNDSKQYVSNAIKTYCKSILDAMFDNSPDLINCYNYEF